MMRIERLRTWSLASVLARSGLLLAPLAAACQEQATPDTALLEPGDGLFPEGPYQDPSLGAPSAWFDTRELGRATPWRGPGVERSPGITGPPGSSSGDDLFLFGTREPTLVANPLDPRNLAYASLFELRVSTDGGHTWKPGVPPVVEADQEVAGNPVLAFDSRGRLFWSYLGRALDPDGAPLGQDVYVAECDPATGALLPGQPVDVTSASPIGRPAANGFTHDKQWLFADAHPASPFRDRLYLAWTEFLPSDTAVRFARSEDGGATWRRGPTLSLGTDGFVWPVHGTTAPNGDVFVGYHERQDASGASGQVLMHRSVDGGATFLAGRSRPFRPGRADVTFNVQDDAGAVPGATFWLQGSAQAWILAHPTVAGRLFVVASDDPDDDHATGDVANVYIVRSDDNGATWTPPRRIDADPGTGFQVMPTAAIDPVTGMIVVHWYDSRRAATNTDGNFLLDTYATLTVDDGRTFCPPFRLNDLPFDPDPGAPVRFVGPPATTRIGDYNGVVALGGRAYAVWCGNQVDAQVAEVSQQILFDAFGLPLDMDFKPGGGENGVNLGNQGVLPVAIRGSAGFDVTSLDPLSATFGPGAATERHGRGHYGDGNNDGHLDLVLHFATQESGLSHGDREVRLEAWTTGGVLAEGSDSLRSTKGFATLLEDFEEGPGAFQVTGSIDVSTSMEAAHDGVLGLRVGGSGGWAWRDDTSVRIRPGDTTSVWLNLGPTPDGRAHFGFGATAAGALSLVAAPGDGSLILERNAGYDSEFLNARPQAWAPSFWYRLEVVWGPDGRITGSLFSSDGTTLLNTVQAFADAATEGGMAFRASGSSDASFDTVQVIRGTESRAKRR